MANSDNSGKIIAALLLGAAIGGVIGVLFAPDKGSETRKKLSMKSEDLTDAMIEKYKEFLGKVEKTKDMTKECIENGHSEAHEMNV